MIYFSLIFFSSSLIPSTLSFPLPLFLPPVLPTFIAFPSIFFYSLINYLIFSLLFVLNSLCPTYYFLIYLPPSVSLSFSPFHRFLSPLLFCLHSHYILLPDSLYPIYTLIIFLPLLALLSLPPSKLRTNVPHSLSLILLRGALVSVPIYESTCAGLNPGPVSRRAAHSAVRPSYRADR